LIDELAVVDGKTYDRLFVLMNATRTGELVVGRKHIPEDLVEMILNICYDNSNGQSKYAINAQKMFDLAKTLSLVQFAPEAIINLFIVTLENSKIQKTKIRHHERTLDFLKAGNGPWRIPFEDLLRKEATHMLVPAEICNKEAAVCSSQGNSPLTTVDDVLRAFLALSPAQRVEFMALATSQMQEDARQKGQPATKEKAMEEANTFNQLVSDETTRMPAPAAIRNEEAAVSSKDKAWSILERRVKRRIGCDKCKTAYESPQARIAFASNSRQADACNLFKHAVSVDDLVSMVRDVYAQDQGDKKISEKQALASIREDVMELMKEKFDGLTPLGDESSRRAFQISLYEEGGTKALRFQSPHYMFPGVMIVGGDTAEGAGEAGMETSDGMGGSEVGAAINVDGSICNTDQVVEVNASRSGSSGKRPLDDVDSGASGRNVVRREMEPH